jgi:4'-phosphopantetheinyl transferase
VLYQIFDDMNQCSEQEIARLLNIVSTQRREQALRYTHLLGQYCCLKSYEMLQHLLTAYLAPISNSPLGRPIAASPRPIASKRCLLNTPSFLYNEHGAPYLEDGPYFSISHCKQGIAVAVSDTPIGIDIETIRPLNEGLVHKAMNLQEQAQIATAANPAQEFIRLWTRKEAYVKMQGTGIISEMHNILSNTLGVTWEESLNTEKEYICTICKKDIR